MQTENIFPANRENQPPHEASSSEFQKMLYHWYEEKNLISNLRSYLRLLMINKLRDTTVGKYEKKITNFSLSKQAFCLVIAEHLLREGCHYTLSIFSTEVPVVANQLPFSLYEAACSNLENAWKFDNDSVLNILELIGITKESSASLKIIGLYNRGFGSVLSCIVAHRASRKGTQNISTSENNETDFLSYLTQILTNLGSPKIILEDVEARLNSFVSQECRKGCESKDAEIAQLQLKLQAEIESRDHKISSITKHDEKLKKSNKKLKSEVKNLKKSISQQEIAGNVLKMKEQALGEKLEEMYKLETEVKLSLEKIETQKICYETHCSEKCEANSDMKESLQKQVLHLQELNNEKDMEIERLHAKISLLTKDLENSRDKVQFLNSCLSNLNHINIEKDYVYESSGESSDNITEEILKQVRSRLVQLEQESEQLDRKFKNLRK